MAVRTAVGVPHAGAVRGYWQTLGQGRETSVMTNHPEETSAGHAFDEPLVDDLVDETRGPEEDTVTGEHPDLLREEVADDLKPRD